MGDAQTRTQGAQQHAQTLALADLRTVQWIAAQTLVKEAYNVGKPRYIALKQAAIIGWFIVFYEMVVVWWWTLVHNLPWPTLALTLLGQADSLLVRGLDFTQQRLDWVSGMISTQVLPYLTLCVDRIGVHRLFNNSKTK